MRPAIVLGKARQKTSRGDRAGGAPTNVSHISKWAVDLRLILVPERQAPGAITDAFAGRRDGQGIVDLTRWFAWAALALLILEIAWRRFGARLPRGIFRRLEKRQRTTKAMTAPSLAEPKAAPKPAHDPKPVEADELLDVLDRMKNR